MIPLEKRETKLLILIHGWSSIVLGLLLYAVVLTGTVSVLAKEIGYWSASQPVKKVPFADPVNEIVNKLSKKVGRAYRDDVSISTNIAGNLSIFFHKHIKTSEGFSRDRGVIFEVNPQTGEILNRREGTGLELFKTDQPSALKRFLVDAHVRLYLPSPWGLLVTGVLGLVMMLAAVTGLFMHRHLLRDIFTLRKRKTSVLEQRDKHSVAASWGLPFAFLLAFTGCFFSFATSFGIPALAMVAFGGNQAQLVRTVAGAEFTRPGRRMQTGNIDVMIKDAEARAASVATSISIEHFGRKNALVTIASKPTEGSLEGKTYQYNGLDGSFKRIMPSIGIVPSMGAKIVTIIGPLHFGNFAGILSKAIWVALGFSSCYIILSGLTLWVRRRKENAGWRVFERLIHVFGLGLPSALAVSAIAFFAFVGSPAVLTATPLGFVVAAMFVILLSLFLSSEKLEKILWALLAITLFLLPICRYVSSDLGWGAALEAGAITVIAIDLLFILSGIICVYIVKKKSHQLTIKA